MTIPFRPALFAAATFTIAACASSSNRSEATGPTSAAITEADMRRRLFLIADDSMMGRETGSEGNFKTAEYVANEFKRLGLEPAGDNGTYFQTVPFFNAAPDPASTLRVGNAVLRVPDDFVPNSFAAPRATLNDVPVVFGGLVTDTTTWIPTAQAAGKFVVLYLPPNALPRAVPPAHWTGAAALGLVTLDAMAPEQLARITSGRLIQDTSRFARALPIVNLRRRSAGVLLGADPASLRPGAGSLRVTGMFDVARTPVKYAARNVVAILRGSDPARNRQYVALTAHNDHVGFDHFPVDHDSLRAYLRVVRPMGADSPARPATPDEQRRINAIRDSLRKVNKPRLDSIRNGADDDGSGTVGLLEIAEAMAKGGKRPARSILFVNHVAEEAGLLGSAWYAAHPTVPRDSIVAEIDEDMIGRGARDDFPRDNGKTAADPQYLEVVGARRLSREFGDSLEAANARQPMPFKFDYTYDADGHPLQYYCRADHYNYAKYGIPAVAFSRGEHLDYHQVTDEPQYINYPDMARVSKMVFDAAMSIANMSHRPALSVPKPTNPNAPCRQ